jgi:hypothetical protein
MLLFISSKQMFVDKVFFISEKQIKYTISCSRYNKINIENFQGGGEDSGRTIFGTYPLI